MPSCSFVFTTKTARATRWGNGKRLHETHRHARIEGNTIHRKGERQPFAVIVWHVLEPAP